MKHTSSVSGERQLLLAFLLVHRRAALLAFALDLLANSCVIALSLLLAQTVAALFGFRSIRGSLLGIPPDDMAGLLVWLAGVIALKCLLDYARLRLRGILSEDFAHHLRTLAFQHHLRADLRHHETRDTGKSLLRFSGDLGSTQRLLTRGVFQAAADLTLLLMGLGLIAWLDGRLALLVGGLAAMSWFLMLQINRRLRDIEERRRSKKASLLALVSATLLHLPGIQALNRGTRAAQHFGRKAEKVLALGHRYHRLAAVSEALPLFFVQALLLAVLVFGWQSGLSGSVLFTVVLVLMSWRSPLARLLRAGLLWEKGLLSLKKMDVLLRSPATPEGTEVLEKKRARTLRLHHVTLRFGEKTALHNLSFQLAVGETLALNIGTGGGKTTLAKLLAGLYRPDAGSIEWDGQPTENLTVHSQRRQLAVVSEAFPLSGTNLLDALSNSGQADALANAEVELRHWQSLFEVLQDIDFQEKTTLLSAGQQHLLQCLRAVLSDKPFLVLDEPFAALDTATAKILAGVLEKYRSEKALLLLTAQPEILPAIGWGDVRWG